MREPGSGVGAASKPCTRCKQVKPLAEFGVDPRMRSGRRCACRACLSRREVEKYEADPAFRAAKLAQMVAYRAGELGGLVSELGCCHARLRGAVKEVTKDRLRRRIAELDGRIAELRAGRGHRPEQERSVA